jgi:hypothetical protein
MLEVKIHKRALKEIILCLQMYGARFWKLANRWVLTLGGDVKPLKDMPGAFRRRLGS